METARLPAGGQILADVLRQIPCREPCVAERPGPHRQIAEQLDVDVPASPRPLDVTLGDPAPDGKVGVESVPARMPLRSPQVRERLADDPPQTTEEVGQVG